MIALKHPPAIAAVLSLFVIAGVAAGAEKTSPAPTAPAPETKLAAPPLRPAATPRAPEVAEIGPGIWVGVFDGVNSVWLDLGDGIAVIDTTGSEQNARALKERIEETTKGKPVRWLILTHLHGDVNSAAGLPVFLSTDVPVYVHHRVATAFNQALVAQGLTVPPIVSVGTSTVITGAKRTLEVVGLASPAHSSHDVMAFLPELGLAIVGDVLIPGRCPTLTDPSADLAGMLAAMDLLQKKSLRGILASGGGSSDPGVEIEATRAYAKRLLKLLFEMRQENVPPAKIASHIRLNPIQGYCAGAIDTKNAVALYERMTPEGKLLPGPGATQKGPEKE